MYYLNLDNEGRLLSVSTTPMADCPSIDSLDGYDFTGYRVGAYRWTGEALTLDEAKLAELESAAEAQRRAEGERAALAKAADEVQAALLTMQINSIAADDDTALRWRLLYPVWEEGTAYVQGYKVQFGEKLFRCAQAHTSQSGWEPGTAFSLWEEICENHTGAIDDPIPFDIGMAVENGKYYTQGGKTYLCTRDSLNPLYNDLEDLVGIYVEEV